MKLKKIFISFLVLLILFLCLAVPVRTEARVGGSGRYIGQALGITRGQLVNSLNRHRYDSYYLGTCFRTSANWYDLIYPNGAPLNGWYTGMNCAGWVSRAFMDAGANLDPINRYKGDNYNLFCCAASTWLNYVLKTDTRYFVYESKEEMLADGKLRKGDIIMTEPRDWSMYKADTHLCIFWGDYPSDDKTWHQTAIGNNISEIRPGCANSRWFVFPIDSVANEYYPPDYTGVKFDEYYYAWVYTENGKIDWSKNGLVQKKENGGWFYFKNGFLDWSANTFAQVNGQGAWWLVRGGQIDFAYNSLIKWGDDWLYVHNGYVDYDHSGLVYYNGKWFYVKNGKADWSHTGLEYYNGGWFYVKNGTLDWSMNTLAQIDGYDAWWLVRGGQIDFAYNSLIKWGDDWLYVHNGYVDYGHSGLVYYNGKWFYVKNGKVDWSHTGLEYYNGGWFYVKNGILDWSMNTLAQIDGYDAWWLVRGGHIDFEYDSLIRWGNDWLYVHKGYVDYAYTGLAYYSGKWFYVKGGKLDWSYTGIAQYGNAWFYVKRGELDCNYNGTVEYLGYTFNVRGGVVVWN